MLIFLSCVVFSQDKGFNYDSLYQKMEQSNKIEDFNQLYEQLYFEAGLANGHYNKLLELGAAKSDSLGFRYLYGRFIFLQSIAVTILGDYSRAITIANESLKIMEELNEYTELSECYNTIGGMVAYEGDVALGKSYLRKAIKENHKEPTDTLYHMVDCNHLIVLGNIYLNNDEMDSARYVLEKAMHVALSSKFDKQEMFCLVNLGKIHKKNGDYALAKKYFHRAIRKPKKNLQLQSLVSSYQQLADIYIMTDQIDSVIWSLDQGVKASILSEGFVPVQVSLLSKKADLYAKQGHYNLAYELLKRTITLKDSLFTVEKIKEVERVKATFEAKQKDQNIELLSKKTVIQALEIQRKNQILIIILLVMATIGLAWYFIYKQRRIIQDKETNELQKQFRTSELKALRSQMNPHFVFNALNSIQEYIVTNEKQLAGRYLGKFAKLMRIFLDFSNKKKISLQEEVDALGLYLELEILRVEDLKYSIDIDENVDLGLEIPSLLLQPYVENAIKHGLLHKEGDKRLTIAFAFDESSEVLTCKITDNGIGRKQSMLINQRRNPNHKAFGSSATKHRIELLIKENEFNLSEEIIDLHDQNMALGTEVIIKI